jgi:hypothetical protein
MLSMAKGMKYFATQFKEQFEKDDLVMQNISKSQNSNMSKTTDERDNLAKI